MVPSLPSIPTAPDTFANAPRKGWLFFQLFFLQYQFLEICICLFHIVKAEKLAPARLLDLKQL